jgi:hypothetical protein
VLTLFKSIYMLFGSFYGQGMALHLKGMGLDGLENTGTPWYTIFGIVMVLSTGLIYAWQYHLLDSPKWSGKKHWWVFASLAASLNYCVGFLTTWNTVLDGEFCDQLTISLADCFGFGLSNALWSLLLYWIITATSLFRQFSVNCKFTTFYRP